MINKEVASPEVAIGEIHNGATILSSGFGDAGNPVQLLEPDNTHHWNFGMRSIWEVEAFRAFSRRAGATYLPPDVLKISFLRPVIFKKPSSSNSPLSPVWNQPFLITSSVFSWSL